MPGKITLPFKDTIQTVDWVEYDGRIWLVPAWTISPDGLRRRPQRLVGLASGDSSKLSPSPDKLPVLFAALKAPLSLLTHGVVPAGRERVFEVREASDIPDELWLPVLN